LFYQSFPIDVALAPGADLERDVLAQMDFVPAVLDPLPAMPTGIFHELWGDLRSLMAAKPPAVKTPGGARVSSVVLDSVGDGTSPALDTPVG
jgi:hypothetical protein